MFDIKIVETILKFKNDELTELQNNQTSNSNDIDDLKKEIEYLNSIVTRHKIAVLLKLDNDEVYRSVNYLGIEEEDINNYNLSQTELTEYNNLISQLPKEQLQRYKIRKEMSRILGNENSSHFSNVEFAGIEKIDPTLVKYNLTSEQIKNFNDLINQINNLNPETTKSIDLNQEASTLIRNTIKKLDIDDSDEYERIKNDNLDTIYTLTDYVTGLGENPPFFFIESNYELARELANKYPNLEVTVGLVTAEKLLKDIENSTIDRNNYNEYIDLLTKSIKKIYAHSSDDKKQQLENTVNSINKNNYSLRYDLLSKLNGINNLSMDIQDYELDTAFFYLDGNYDSLEETERDKIYNLIERKIIQNTSDMYKINHINILFLNVKNASFRKKLQEKLSSNDKLEFGNQHENSYKLLVEQQISKLEREKSKIASKKSRNLALGVHYDSKIRAIEKEIEKLNAIKEAASNSQLLEILDDAYDNKTDKIIDLTKEIEELKKLRDSITSNFHRKIVENKITRKNNKINKIKNSKVKIIGIQKKIMAPKLFVNQKRGMLNRHFEAKSEILKEYSDDYRKIAATERNLSGLFSPIKAAFYDMKAGIYSSKSKFNFSICQIFNNSRIIANGANQSSMNINQLNQIRNQPQQVVVNTI